MGTPQASRDFAGTNSGKLYAGSAGEAALGTAEKGFEQSGWKTCPMVTPVGFALGQLNMQLLRLLVARMAAGVTSWTRIVQLSGIILAPNRDGA